MESLLGEAKYSPLQTRVPVRKHPKFWSDRWITLKIIKEFPDAGFHGVDVESLHGEVEVSSLHTREPVRKGTNFWSDRWITFQIIEEFPDIIFLEVDVESLFGEVEARRSRPEYRLGMAITFDPTIGSSLKL